MCTVQQCENIIDTFKMDSAFVLVFFIVSLNLNILSGSLVTEWKASENGQFMWRSDCVFYGGNGKFVEGIKTFEECGVLYLNRPLTCNHFIHYNDDDGDICLLMWKAEPAYDTYTDALGRRCAFIPGQIWPKLIDDERMQVQSNCTFPSTTGRIKDGSSIEKSFASCLSVCLKDPKCIAFSYNRVDGKCITPHKISEVENYPGTLEFDDLFSQNNPTRTISSSSNSDANFIVISTRDWLLSRDFSYQRNCDFKGFGIEEPSQMEEVHDCRDHCLENTNCTHYSYYQNVLCKERATDDASSGL